MKTLKLDLPENIDLKDFDLSMILASKLYEDGKLSSGQAAKLAGLSKRAFLELLGVYGVSFMSSSIEELHNDINNA